MLGFLKRHGVEGVCGSVPQINGVWKLDDLLRLRERVEGHGLTLDVLALPLSSVPIDQAENGNIMLGRSPARDRELDHLCDMIQTSARAGVTTLKYNLTLLGVLRTGTTPGRGGSRYSSWSLAQAQQRNDATSAGIVGADEMWERIAYFLKRVVPVAAACRVRLACHPHDPGVPPDGFQGVARVLGTVDGLKRFVELEASPWHGLNFCQGSVAEMLAAPGHEIFAVIRDFGQRNKIFNVHFRNIRGRRDQFQEVYPDEGDVDMARAIKVYHQVGYRGLVMPDHLPQHPDDPQSLQAFAFGYGYIKALIQASATKE